MTGETVRQNKQHNFQKNDHEEALGIVTTHSNRKQVNRNKQHLFLIRQS